MNTEIKFLQVKFGDCFLIKTFDNEGKEFSILIDGGPENSYKIALKRELQDKSKIDLLIITHVDLLCLKIDRNEYSVGYYFYTPCYGQG